jgi:hypothetical protein
MIKLKDFSGLSTVNGCSLAKDELESLLHRTTLPLRAILSASASKSPKEPVMTAYSSWEKPPCPDCRFVALAILK